jgi:hypothetical protein
VTQLTRPLNRHELHKRGLAHASEPAVPVSALRALLEQWMDHDGNLVDDGVTALMALCDKTEQRGGKATVEVLTTTNKPAEGRIGQWTLTPNYPTDPAVPVSGLRALIAEYVPSSLRGPVPNVTTVLLDQLAALCDRVEGQP